MEGKPNRAKAVRLELEETQMKLQLRGIEMKFVAAAIAAAVLALGAAGQASAQPEADPQVVVDNENPTAGDTVTVNVTEADPDVPVEVTLGDQTASGMTDGDGAASVAVTVPDSPGELDGIVNINGKDVPIAVLIQAKAAAAEGDDAGEAGAAAADGDDALPASGIDDPGTLVLIAAGLLLAGTALVLTTRRHGPEGI